VLALGIGANTAIFSIVYSVLLKPLPYRDPGRLVVALHEGRYPVSPADFLDYQAQVHAFEHLAAAQAWGGSLRGAGKAEEIPGLQVSANLFATLGVAPLLGRTFIAGEDQPGAPHVLVIGYGLWQREFGGRPDVVGRTIQLTDKDYTIVSVMPPQFQFAPFWQTEAEMWTPLVLGNRVTDRAGSSLRLFARLRAGVSLAQAQAQMNTVARRLAAA
jgi:putative ABC transport system permease protein